MRARIALSLPVAALALVGGCDDTFISISSDGRIDVIISSVGPGGIGGGLRLTVDGSTTEFLIASGSATLTGLSQGSHSVLLGGLPDNCGVEGANPRTVVVTADGTAALTFVVFCDRSTTGALSIRVATTGEPADSDGYLLVVGEGGVRLIASSATETFTGLPAGVHLVELKNIAPGCKLEGGNPQPAVVVAGRTESVGLVVNCGAPTR
jgi:hypothetical protein